MEKKSTGSENLIGVGGSTKDGAAKIWSQLVVGMLSNFKNRILRGWLSSGPVPIWVINPARCNTCPPLGDIRPRILMSST